MKRTMWAAAVALALTAAPAFAQSSQTHAQKPQTKGTSGAMNTPNAVAPTDAKFMKEAAHGGLAEVELGNLAKDKASNDQVKQFASRMVDDHSKANDELKTLAGNKNVQLPTTLDAKDQALKDRLSKLSGQEFDRAYMQAMVKDHRTDVNEFRKASTSAKDPDVKAFAAKTLPTLEEHLKLAQQDSNAVGTSGSKTTHPKGTSGKK